MSESACKSCGAPIRWALTEQGRRMPLDAQPKRRFVMDGDTCRSTLVYDSHWGSCPSADQHREDAP